MKTRLQLWASIMLIVVCSQTVVGLSKDNQTAHKLFENGFYRTLHYLYNQCADSEDMYWCSKVQMTKMLGRALKVSSINILDGLSMVKKLQGNETRAGRSSASEASFDNQDVERLSSKTLDALLFDRVMHFLNSRQLQVNLPRLLSFSQAHVQQLLDYVMSFFEQTANIESVGSSEGRHKKKDDKKYLGPFIAAVMLKAAILKMAYHSIAILAGKALIVGKIALIISAIIGLKKLVSSEGGEKTTYEIVKHPQVQQSHTYSSSHAGDYDSGHESGGAYHRSIDDEMMMQDKAYNSWVPTTKVS